MPLVDANAYDYRQLVQVLADMKEEKIEVNGLCGHRYIACGWKNNKHLLLKGTAGNNLGAFCEGPEIVLHGNAQEGTANTMTDGRIVVHGRVGDIAGYAMRGGELFIKGDAGYRLAIHMKAYRDKNPLIVVGGSSGAFTGEYMAGGTVIILGLNKPEHLVGPYCGTGMYGGAIYLRGEYSQKNLAENLQVSVLSDDEKVEIKSYLQRFAQYFQYSLEEIMAEPFTRICAANKRPYANLYTGYL